MHRSRFGTRGSCVAAALMLLVGSSTVVAQDDPAADLPADDDVAAGGDASGGAEAGAAVEGEVGADAAVEAGAVEEVPTVELAEPMKPAAESSSGDIIVTGSRIKRSSFAQPSAVAVVDRKQLALSGSNNMTEVARTMNINSGSELNADISGGSAGTAQFNLRGLGLSSTLVLLNGRRLVQAATLAGDGSNYVDINTLPMQMVERIEILKGGASAIYGSDAVAGVVNVITRKNYDGFEAQVGGQTTDSLDQHEWDVSLIGGAKSDTSRVMATVAYLKREPLQATDRDFTLNHKNVSNIGWPGTYLALAGASPDFPNSGRDWNCANSKFSNPAARAMPEATSLPFCTFDFNSYYMLVLDEQRINTYATAEHDVSDHTMAFFEAGYARNNTTRELSPSFPILQTILVPPDNAYNPTGKNLKVYARLRGGNAGPLTQYFQSDTLHTVAGIGGDFAGLSDSKFGDWEWELAGTYSTSRSYGELADQLKGPLQTAISSCKPTDDPANCVNLFYAGAPNSQAILNKVTGRASGMGKSELTTIGADINGPIVKMPGGDLAIALGTQIRREIGGSRSDHDSTEFNYLFLLGASNFVAERRIVAGYGELSLPFFQGFEGQVAGRLENYSDVGSAFNPMFGISWTPATSFMGDEATQASKVRLRGTYANSFRVPSLLQTDGSQTTLDRITATTQNAMTGAPMAATTATFLAIRSLGNPDLEPQTSTAITGGIEWSPVQGFLLEADYWNYDYQKIIVRENAQQLVDADYMAATPTNPLGNPAVRRDPASRVPTGVDTKFINASSVMTHGIDLELGYREKWFGPDAGVFSVGVGGTYVLSYEIPYNQAAAINRDFADSSCSGKKTCDVAGNRNLTNFARPIPRLRASLPISWSLEGHSAAVIGHFIGGYDDDEAQIPAVTHFIAVDPFLTFDLQYAYRIDEGDGQATKFTVGVLNIADTDPPPLNTPLGYDTGTHDPRGRMIYGRITQEL